MVTSHFSSILHNYTCLPLKLASFCVCMANMLNVASKLAQVVLRKTGLQPHKPFFYNYYGSCCLGQ